MSFQDRRQGEDMKKRLLITACALLAVGAFGIGGNEAAAQCGYGGGYGYGGGGYGTYGGGYRPAYRTSAISIGIGSYNRGYGYSTYRSRHRGHYDWHRTTVVPHGNHLHVRPGHYDYHRGRHHGHHGRY
jgi:hypothetical protein